MAPTGPGPGDGCVVSARLETGGVGLVREAGGVGPGMVRRHQPVLEPVVLACPGAGVVWGWVGSARAGLGGVGVVRGRAALARVGPVASTRPELGGVGVGVGVVRGRVASARAGPVAPTRPGLSGVRVVRGGWRRPGPGLGGVGKGWVRWCSAGPEAGWCRAVPGLGGVGPRWARWRRRASRVSGVGRSRVRVALVRRGRGPGARPEAGGVSPLRVRGTPRPPTRLPGPAPPSPSSGTAGARRRP